MPNSKFKSHPIIEKLTSSAGGAVKFLGYFGSAKDGVVKVYPSLDDLSVCLLIKEADILHVEEAASEELSHGGSAIWVKADATIERVVNQATSMQARFLAGEIAAKMAGGPAVAYSQALRQPQQGDTWGGEGCQFSVWPCSQLIGACLKSNDMPCAYTEQWWCPGNVLTAQSCFTCAGYTCVAECYSVGCPYTVRCPQTQRTHCVCNVYSAFCPIR
jgi:hypothetical protein